HPGSLQPDHEGRGQRDAEIRPDAARGARRHLLGDGPLTDGRKVFMKPDTPDDAAANVITGPEAEAQLRYVERAIKAASDDERKAALSDGLLAFGVRFVMLWELLEQRAAADSGFIHETGERVMLLFVAWLKGKTLTARADEPERRALAAL